MEEMKNIKLFLTSQISCVAHHIPRFLSKSPKDLNLAFIDTAAEVEKGDLQWLKKDRQSLVKVGFKIFDFTITGKKATEIKEKLDKTDVLYFSGGNQFYLLKKMQESNILNLIRDYVRQGKIYIGSSAGSVIAGPDLYITRFIDEARKAYILDSYEGLNLVNFTVFPHWGDEYFKKLYFNQRLKTAYNLKSKIILLT
ncbi:hypothetical protein A2W14_06315, partial [Candidatus Gottesmanbacteria bacterium RBG_16_37_8]